MGMKQSEVNGKEEAALARQQKKSARWIIEIWALFKSLSDKKKYVFDTVNILWDLFFTNRNSLHQKLPKKVTSCKEQQQPERRQELPSESCAGDHEPPASPIRNALGQVNMQMFSVISLFEATEAVCIFGLFWFFSSPTFVTSLQYIW